MQEKIKSLFMSIVGIDYPLGVLPSLMDNKIKIPISGLWSLILPNAHWPLISLNIKHWTNKFIDSSFQLELVIYQSLFLYFLYWSTVEIKYLSISISIPKNVCFSMHNFRLLWSMLKARMLNVTEDGSAVWDTDTRRAMASQTTGKHSPAMCDQCDLSQTQPWLMKIGQIRNWETPGWQ